MKKNTIISITSCTLTSAILWFVAPSKRKSLLKRLPFSLMLAALWGRFLDFKAEQMESNKLVNDVIKTNIGAARINSDEFDDNDDDNEDFREI